LSDLLVENSVPIALTNRLMIFKIRWQRSVRHIV